MKLIDKIQKAQSGKLSDYSTIYTPTAEVIEQIADDYAIEFKNFCDKKYNYNIEKLSTEVLLEIFKKEKEL